MPTLDGRIDNLVVGNALKVTRTITSVPASATLTKAWLTVKEHEDDDDAAAIFQKAITVTDVPGTGQITDAGGSGTGVVRFDLTKVDTKLLTPRLKYAYDIKVLASTGDPYTGEKGILTTVGGVTDADT